jgi:hypothetical protein
MWTWVVVVAVLAGVVTWWRTRDAEEAGVAFGVTLFGIPMLLLAVAVAGLVAGAVFG